MPKYTSQTFKEASYDRRIRIINHLIGENRIFQGSIDLPDTIAAQTYTDTDLLSSIRVEYESGTALAFWVDGSAARHNGYADVLGAGVAWQTRGSSGNWEWHERSFGLGVNTGSSNDAELFGIAAALELVVERVKRREADTVKWIRIFTDCREVVERFGNNTIAYLGPAIGGTWALEDVNDYTDLLDHKDIRVQLAWQKGHAMSEGNVRADRAAYRAVTEQFMSLGGESMGWRSREDAPWQIVEAGEDSVEEWYCRVNRHLLLGGRAEEEEEDTVSQGSADMDLSE
jgi:ribonuclease HI